jgi:hypothetical protein
MRQVPVKNHIAPLFGIIFHLEPVHARNHLSTYPLYAYACYKPNLCTLMPINLVKAIHIMYLPIDPNITRKQGIG